MKKQPSPEGCFFSYIRGFAAGYIFLPFGQKAKGLLRLRRSANAALSLPLGEGGTARRSAVTDEGSPLKAGFTAARTLANLWSAAGAASAHSEEGAGFCRRFAATKD